MDLFVCEISFRLWMTSHNISEADGFCGTLIWWSIFFLFLMSIPFYQFVSLQHGGHRGSDVWMLMSRRKAVLKGSLDSCSPKLTGSQKCLSEVLVPSVCIEISIHSLTHSADSCCAPAVLQSSTGTRQTRWCSSLSCAAQSTGRLPQLKPIRRVLGQREGG